MSTSSSLNQRINDLERRLKVENKSRDNDRQRHLVPNNDLVFPRPFKPEPGHTSPRKPRACKFVIVSFVFCFIVLDMSKDQCLGINLILTGFVVKIVVVL